MRIGFLNPQGNFDPTDSHWTEHPDFGGQLVYVKEVGLALARLGIEVDILTRRILDPDWPEFSAPITHYDSERERLRIVRIPCGGDDFLAKEALWPYLREWVAGIVKFYGNRLPDFFTGHYADGGYAGVILKQQHASGFTFTGHSLGAQKLDKLDMNLANSEVLDARFHFSRRIAAERLSMCEASRIITSTGQERMEQYAHPLYASAVDSADDERFAVIPPGVNTRIFCTKSGTADETVTASLAERLPDLERPRIVISSRLDEKKNILGAVRAFCDSPVLRQRARLALYLRDVDDPFEQIKNLPPDERSVLEPILRLIDSSGARGHVDFINATSQQELAASYRFFAQRGSVFVLSSLYEPFGLAPIEAGACGLAVVATRNGGPSEIFADGSGVLVDPANPAAIAEGIARAMKDHGGYAERIRHRVRSIYTWERTAESYLAVIEAGCRSTSTMRSNAIELDASVPLKRYLARRGE
jgi:sucrose-phosphate synthase